MEPRALPCAGDLLGFQPAQGRRRGFFRTISIYLIFLDFERPTLQGRCRLSTQAAPHWRLSFRLVVTRLWWCPHARLLSACKCSSVFCSTPSQNVSAREMMEGLSGFLSWCQMSKILTTYLFAKVIFGLHTRKGKTQEIGAGVYK